MTIDDAVFLVTVRREIAGDLAAEVEKLRDEIARLRAIVDRYSTREAAEAAKETP